MEKRHKDILRTLVAELRRTLAGTADGSRRGDLDRALERLGIATDGAITPFDALPNPTPAERHARQVAEAELSAVDVKERPGARAAFVERAAYGWVNRLLALRVLEARGLIDETLRGNPAYDGLSEALYVLRQSDPARASGPDGGWWAVIEDACASQAAALPGLFALDSPRTAGSSSALHDPAIALRPGATALVRCVELLGAPPAGTPKGQEEALLAEMDAAFADPDAIGWAYQFYQDEAKAQVYARLKAGKKVTTRDDISAATQLFTEPYMVQWLLQNSLGRSYHEAYPQSDLPATWAYYIRPERLDVPAFSTLESLTLLDPCVGSGHFVREAFDMFVAMYREQQPSLSAIEIADRILEHHLYGIDIDPRAAQLAAFTLYARAWELVRDERRTQRRPGCGSYTPKAMNLAASPERIASGALARHLQRHPEDRMLEPLLKGVFAALERADILGSLLRPREHLQAAIAELRQPHNLHLGTVEEQDLQVAIETVAYTDPAHLEEMLLDRVASGFAAEARDIGDVAAALFGRAAERGVRLLQLLDRRYAVVVTNPPYMGSKNMDIHVRQYVERHYKPGKRDLYAAFILRCLELAGPEGRVAMVTQQSWMLLQSFSALRTTTADVGATASESFTGLLHSVTIEELAHLGVGAFGDISGEVVNTVLLVCQAAAPSPQHRLAAVRAVDGKSLQEKVVILQRCKNRHACIEVLQSTFAGIEGSPLIYWMPSDFLHLFTMQERFGSILKTKQGVVTGDNERFSRLFWETPNNLEYDVYLKGLGYQRWYGFTELCICWSRDRVKISTIPVGRVKSEDDFSSPGWTYSSMAQGFMSPREYKVGWKYDNRGPVVLPKPQHLAVVGAILASHLGTTLLRYITQGNDFNSYHVDNLPLWIERIDFPFAESVAWLVQATKGLARRDPVDRLFEYNVLMNEKGKALTHNRINQYCCEALRLSVEAVQEAAVHDLYKSSEAQSRVIFDETGIPAGYFKRIRGFDDIRAMAQSVDINPLLIPYVESAQVSDVVELSHSELNQLRSRLKSYYEAGPGVKAAVYIESPTDNDDEVVSHKPLPADTYIEELSLLLKIHPVSTVYLIQSLDEEGIRCKPEEQRLLEDRLSVIVLRLLGHRWPKQLEVGDPVPKWADQDGIIPLLPGSGEAPLADRVRDRLRAEDGDLGVQQMEALLAELTGQNLETWIRRTFFPRHVRQFKSRPIAWHLASTPMAVTVGRTKDNKGTSGARQAPAFECLVYYHACGLALLARLRTQYIEPLLRAGQGKVDAARQAEDDTATAQAAACVLELEAFIERLRGVEEQGFDIPSLEEALSGEPLDRLSGDGILPLASSIALLAQERAWAVDIADGIRLNIAPLQLAGVLASDVLKEADAKKALVDRARWRADERRWVRKGVLPRCGWMSEDIPESPRWTERAPERDAEQRKLERKRADAMARLAQGEGGSD